MGIKETFGAIRSRLKHKQVDLEEYLADARQRGLDANGHFIPDSTPLAPPIGYKRSPTIAENIRAMIKSERLKQEVEAAGAETFEEAEDFDIEDDPVDPHTPYDNQFDPPLSELVSEGNHELAAKQAANPPTDGPKAPEPPPPSSKAPPE